MTYRMYIDDERDPKTDHEWVVVRSVAAAQDMITRFGFPNYISFDHDLGDGVPTGFDLAKWLVHEDLERSVMPDDFDFNVHSANPVGRDNIVGYLNNYLDFRNHEDK